MIKELIKKNRSYRRFHENERIDIELLKGWIDLARLSASAKNAQSLKYYLITGEEECEKLFPLLAWAGYLKDWPGPAKGERPSAYIVMLNDRDISTNYYCDHGIAAQSILLGAVEAGFGGCIIASVNRKELSREFSLDERFEVLQVLALGKPAETVVIETMKDGDFKYWRDRQGVHHVPKRPLDELIIKNTN
jgi:nitroreductase